MNYKIGPFKRQGREKLVHTLIRFVPLHGNLYERFIGENEERVKDCTLDTRQTCFETCGRGFIKSSKQRNQKQFLMRSS